MNTAYNSLKESREDLISRFLAGQVKDGFQEEYSEMIDQYFRVSIQESDIGRALFKDKVLFALIAVGGYGRQELCLHSDIDILILFHRKIPQRAKEFSEEIFFPLWDLGLDIGHGVRNFKDCLSLGKKDFEVLTSMLDSRFICGDSQLFIALMGGLKDKVINKESAAFNRWLEEVDKIRLDKFGDASHLLEPNLKDGIGGLRDYHHILWISKVLFQLKDPRELEYLGKLSHKEYQELEKQVKFILFVRNHLHEISGRKNDRLSFEYQEKIAKRLGFKNQKRIAAVEQFLGKLHFYMESIKITHRSFLKSNIQTLSMPKERSGYKEITEGIYLRRNDLFFIAPSAIPSSPNLLIRIFEQSCVRGNHLSVEAKRLVTEFLYLVDDGFRSSAESARSFFNIINGKNTSSTLDQMAETDFLSAFLPEFGKIRNRVQFDAYHIFPVGRHMLETVRYLKNLSQEKEVLLLDTYSDLKDHEILFMAGFLHDIGKNGSGHAKKGVKISREILQRLGYPEEKTAEVLFQVQYHLFLAETATRRDLNDEKIIVNGARIIGSINRLKTLYLLTWADSKATGPRAWNDWTGNLIQELFFKILHILERGELATPDSSQKVKRVKTKVRRAIGESQTLEELSSLFEIMPPRYLLNIKPMTIVKHIGMLKRLEPNMKKQWSSAFLIDIVETGQENVFEVSVIAGDRPGLFSDIAGVMALNNINILASNIYTWRDGTAVDIFSVTGPLDSIHPDETWEKIKKNLKDTFNGKLSLPYRLSQKAAPSIISGAKKPGSPPPPEVKIDNSSSDFFTLIEVFAADRVGLLYLITRTLFDLRLDIRVAKTGVKGDQIADIFYVRDLEGQKVEDEDQVKEIKRALIYQLSKD